MNKCIYTILLLILGFTAKTQITEIPEGYILNGVVVDGDTIPSVRIKQIVILPPIEFSNRNDLLKYRRLIRNVKKAYPFALIAKDTFLVVQRTLDSIQDRKQRRKYLKAKDDELQERYSEELKKLTISQGRILIKLIDRELDATSYEVIKQFRGSLTAFFWQQLAKLFGEDLKTEFDSEGEDKLIDRIVIMIENGQL